MTRASNSNNTKGRRRSVVVAPISHGTALGPNRLRRTLLNGRDDDLSEIFVAMCFFARLGFDQPPCCLHCAYRDATKSNSPASSPIVDGDENDGGGGGSTNDDAAKIGECHNLIPWRIDASVLLHPARLALPPPPSPPRTANDDDTTNNSSNAADEENEENSGGENNGSSSSNIVFITCTTAQCLVNGECYPCLRYDGRNKRLLLF